MKIIGFYTFVVLTFLFSISFNYVSATDLFAAQDIHISVSGSDKAGDGSAGSPYASIPYAAQLAKAGDRILVHAGTYYIHKMISFSNNGEAENPIQLLSADGKYSAIIDASQKPYNDAIRIERQYIIIDGFDIRKVLPGKGNNAIAVYGHSNSADGSVVRNCRITGGHNQLKIGGADNILIEKNEFYGKFRHIPISIVGVHNTILRENLFRDWKAPLNNGMLQIKGGSKDVIVERNYFKNIGSICLALGDATSDSSMRGGTKVYEGSGLVARNNVFIRCGRAIDFVDCNNCSAVNNTIVDSGQNTSLIKLAANRNPVRNARIINNIIYNPNRDLKKFVHITRRSGKGIRIDHNLYWNGGARVDFGNRPEESDQHSLISDPLFVDPYKNDYHLQPESPAVDAGSNRNEYVSEDIESVVRPQGKASDIGAYEYVKKITAKGAGGKARGERIPKP